MTWGFFGNQPFPVENVGATHSATPASNSAILCRCEGRRLPPPGHLSLWRRWRDPHGSTSTAAVSTPATQVNALCEILATQSRRTPNVGGNTASAHPCDQGLLAMPDKFGSAGTGLLQTGPAGCRHNQGPAEWFPHSPLNPLTGSAPSYAPTTSPQLRRRHSPWCRAPENGLVDWSGPVRV